jgi:hypothetical protein
MWPVMAIYAFALSGVVFQLVAYRRMPARVPARTSFSGRPSAYTVPRRIVLVAPVVFAGVIIMLWASLGSAGSLPAAERTSVWTGALLVAEASWLLGAIFWDIAAVARRKRTHMPRIVTLGGLVIAVTVIVTMILSRAVHSG